MAYTLYSNHVPVVLYAGGLGRSWSFPLSPMTSISNLTWRSPLHGYINHTQSSIPWCIRPLFQDLFGSTTVNNVLEVGGLVRCMFARHDHGPLYPNFGCVGVSTSKSSSAVGHRTFSNQFKSPFVFSMA
jgi:hypothetical protein